MLKLQRDYQGVRHLFMKLTDTFAVVDLESTGTSFETGDRIIQFSCVFVKNNKIINTFNTLINPEMKIPRETQNLTGITNKDVRNAPYFEDVAGTIYSLLQDTNFVAHNIQFDYRFLNSELERVGYPMLDLACIDTVQLAQVLFPTLSSYRLAELGSLLGIENKRPHRADSDAETTARIFIKLRNRLNSLPFPLLASLRPLASHLLYDTGTLFINAYRNRKHRHQVLSNSFVEVGGILLRRPERQVTTIQPQVYPRKVAQKRKLFGERLHLRNEQARMMDSIDRFWHSSQQKQQLVQAPTGMGKTYGFLLPTLYAVSQGQKFVISTATMALQEQLLKTSLPVLTELTRIPVRALSLKGNSNYIDLARFAQSLKFPQNDNTCVLQMKILVWLSMTETGDFAELHLTTLQDNLFTTIAHHGLAALEQTSPFYEYDFVRRQALALKSADIVVTNHAYLLQHAVELADFGANLIIDEGQDLVTTMTRVNRQVVDFDQVKILADTALVKMESHQSYSFENLVKIGVLSAKQYTTYLRQVQVVDHAVPSLRHRLLSHFVGGGKLTEYTEKLLPASDLNDFIKSHSALVGQINRALPHLKAFGQWLENKRQQAQASGQIGREGNELLRSVCSLLEEINQELAPWSRLCRGALQAAPTKSQTWLTLAAHPTAHLRLTTGYLSGQDYLQQQVYQQFQRVLFMGADLVLPEIDDYMYRQLDLDRDALVETYQGPFDYQKQTITMVATDAPLVTEVPREEYITYLADAIEQICQTPVQTLVLFNALDDIKEVYERLSERGFTQRRTVLAQGINGGAEKLRKRFILGKDNANVLFGTGTFWEGIDLPHDQLQLLIVARLPFQSPDTELNQIRREDAQHNGLDPFSEVLLPEAILRLKQGWGRLIRTPHDQGAFVILDNRIYKKSYGHTMRAAFPNEVQFKRYPTSQIGNMVTKFLAEDN